MNNLLEFLKLFFSKALIFLCIIFIRVYQLFISPIKFLISGSFSSCRFEPSCSCYALEAFKKHRFLYGSFLTIRRICIAILGAKGIDPVPEDRNNISKNKK